MKDAKSGVHFVVDAWWGSSGKGKISPCITEHFGYGHVSSSNHPNAGHVWRSEKFAPHKVTFKALPAASIVSNWVPWPVEAWLTGDSVFASSQLLAEVADCHLRNVHIHPRSNVLLLQDQENEAKSPQRDIASTLQGGCAATIRKMHRRSLGPRIGVDSMFWDGLWDAAHMSHVLHEVAQGTGLSIDHGTHYPHCTYRNCTVGAALDDLGLPARLVREIYLVVRTFPIRVGNVAEGHSGEFPSDCRELTWDEVAHIAGDDERKYVLPEYTTVTKRMRRVATPSFSWLRRAAAINGATKLCITFADYLGIENRNAKAYGDLNYPCRMFIEKCEIETGCRVACVSVGPDHDQIVWLD